MLYMQNTCLFWSFLYVMMKMTAKKLGFAFAAWQKYLINLSVYLGMYYTNLIHSFKSCKKLVFLKKTINLLFNGIVFHKFITYILDALKMLSAFHIRLKMKNLCITITFSIIVIEVNSTMWLKKQNSTYFCIEPNVHTSTSRLRRNATSHFNETLQFIHFKNAALTLLCYTHSVIREGLQKWS